MRVLPVRLKPGDDLRQALAQVPAAHGAAAAFVLAGIGSLSIARLRLAGEPDTRELQGPLEILSLGGSLSAQGCHLHAVVSDAKGRVVGGHVGQGCIVATTAELLVALLDDWQFSRELDPVTGYAELVVRPKTS